MVEALTVMLNELASAMHYFLTASCILGAVAAPIQATRLQQPYEFQGSMNQAALLNAYAAEICGIAFTTKIPSTLVNAFGPISYCAPSSHSSFAFSRISNYVQPPSTCFAKSTATSW